MKNDCPETKDTHRGIGGFGYCTECGYVPKPILEP